MDVNPDMDAFWMRKALDLAHTAAGQGEVPVGALVVLPPGPGDEQGGYGELLGQGSNQPVAQADPTAHAEIVALRAAARRQGNYRLPGAVLYVTLEPCMMCAGALIHARIERLVFAACEPKAGAVSSHDLINSSWLNHRLQFTGGVLAEQSSQLLTDFFARRRAAVRQRPSPTPPE